MHEPQARNRNFDEFLYGLPDLKGTKVNAESKKFLLSGRKLPKLVTPCVAKVCVVAPTPGKYSKKLKKYHKEEENTNSDTENNRKTLEN